MKINQGTYQMNQYLNGTRKITLGREDSAGVDGDGNVIVGSDGVKVPSIHSFSAEDGENVILSTSELDFSSVEYTGGAPTMSFDASGTPRRVGVCPFIELVGDDYIRDSGIKVYTQTTMQVWVFFKFGSSAPGSGWRLVQTIDVERPGYDGWTDIPVIDLYGNHAPSNGATGMFMSMAFQCDDEEAEVKVMSIPDGQSGKYDQRGGGSEGLEFIEMLDTSSGNAYMEWDHSVSPFGVKYSNEHDPKEKLDRSYIIEAIDVTTYEIGESFEYTLQHTNELDSVTLMADDLYHIDSTFQAGESAGLFENKVTFTFSFVDEDGRELLDPESTKFKAYLNLKVS